MRGDTRQWCVSCSCCCCCRQAIRRLTSRRRLMCNLLSGIVLIAFACMLFSFYLTGDVRQAVEINKTVQYSVPLQQDQQRSDDSSIVNVLRAHEKHKHILTQIAGSVSAGRRVCQVYNNASNIQRSVQYNILDKPLVASLITLVTHMSADRMDALSQVARHWKGSMSISLYSTDEERLHFVGRYFSTTSLQRRENIYIHHVPADGEHYPVNFLRNVALTFNDSSRYVFLNDIDFVPDTNIENMLSLYLDLPEMINAKQMLVVPAFEVLKNEIYFPSDKKEVLDQWQLGYISPFHEGNPKGKAGHAPTNFTRWSTANKIYEAEYGELFEPYLVAERSSVPLFPVRFVGRYYNKSSHTKYCHHIGIKFMVIPDTFLIHMIHAKHSSKYSRYWRCAEDQYKIFVKQLQNI